MGTAPCLDSTTNLVGTRRIRTGRLVESKRFSLSPSVWIAFPILRKGRLAKVSRVGYIRRVSTALSWLISFYRIVFHQKDTIFRSLFRSRDHRFQQAPFRYLANEDATGYRVCREISVFKTLLFLFPISECIRHLLLIRVVRGDKDGIGSGRIGLNFRDDPRIAHMEKLVPRV